MIEQNKESVDRTKRLERAILITAVVICGIVSVALGGFCALVRMVVGVKPNYPEGR
jgi:hypothetical protein